MTLPWLRCSGRAFFFLNPGRAACCFYHRAILLIVAHPRKRWRRKPRGVRLFRLASRLPPFDRRPAPCGLERPSSRVRPPNFGPPLLALIPPSLGCPQWSPSAFLRRAFLNRPSFLCGLLADGRVREILPGCCGKTSGRPADRGFYQSRRSPRHFVQLQRLCERGPVLGIHVLENNTAGSDRIGVGRSRRGAVASCASRSGGERLL